MMAIFVNASMVELSLLNTGSLESSPGGGVAIGDMPLDGLDGGDEF